MIRWLAIWLICCSAMGQNLNITNVPLAAGFSSSDTLLGVTNNHIASYPASSFLTTNVGRNLEPSGVSVGTVTNPVFTTAFITNPAVGGSSAQLSISGNTGNGGFQDLITSSPASLSFSLGGSRGITMPKLAISGSGLTALAADGSGLTNVPMAAALTKAAKTTNLVQYFVAPNQNASGTLVSNSLTSGGSVSNMLQLWNLGQTYAGAGVADAALRFQDAAGNFYGSFAIEPQHDGIGPGLSETAITGSADVAIVQGYQFEGGAPAVNGGRIQMGAFINGVGWSDGANRNEVVIIPVQAHNPFTGEATWPTNFSGALVFSTSGFNGASLQSANMGIFSQTVATNLPSSEHRLVFTPELGWDGNHWNPNGANQSGLRIYGGNSNKVEIVDPLETTSLITVSNINTFGTGTNFFAGPIVGPSLQAPTASGFQCFLTDPSGANPYAFQYDGSTGYENLFANHAVGLTGFKLSTFAAGGAPIAIGDRGIEVGTNAIAVWPATPLTRGGFTVINSNAVVYILQSSPAGNAWIDTNGVPAIKTSFATGDLGNSTVNFGAMTADKSVYVVSGRKYRFTFTLFFTESVVGEGIKVDFNGGGAGATNFRVHGELVTDLGAITSLTAATSTTLAGVMNIGTVSSANQQCFKFEGTIEPSSSGTFIPRFAQNSHASGTATALRGSNLVVTECF